MPFRSWSLGLWVMILLLTQINAFSWPKRATVSDDEALPSDSPLSQPHTFQVSNADSGLSNVYAMTLNELQQLESEPLCHRVAARLLIHNCQLLDGKDEATALTDGGRATRDFVDSYAASLAICDLERGSFHIPHSCSKFREASLSRISPPTVPQLHASSAEVERCLEGLAQSDAAWSTWISYRHKALRFCEAARAENEKDRNLHLYRKLTQILEKLTTEVEAEIEARYILFTDIIREAGDRVDELAPRIRHLSNEVGSLEHLLKNDIYQTSQAASQIVRDGLGDAKDLQSTLGLLLRTAMEHNAQLAASHQVALQQSTGQVENEVASIITALATIALSSASLQQDIEHSKNQVYMLAEKQDALETSMEKLANLADDLTQAHENNQRTLHLAQNHAEDLLHTIHSISTSATSLRTSVTSWLSWGDWWPYIVCPTISLTMGSYGLPPSMGRNILLFGLGEAVGFIFSAAYHFPGFSILTTANSSSILDGEDSTYPLITETYRNGSHVEEKCFAWA